MEAEFATQQVGEDRLRERRRRSGRVERRVADVGRHHQRHAGGDRRLERRELAGCHLLARRVDRRQRVVRVFVRVAVAGKVLRGRQEAGSVAATDELGGEFGGPFRVGGERSRRDNRISRVGVHVGDRSERDVDASGPRGLPRQFRKLEDRLPCPVAEGVERHGMREERIAAQLLPGATLQVGRHQQRVCGSAAAAARASPACRRSCR